MRTLLLVCLALYMPAQQMGCFSCKKGHWERVWVEPTVETKGVHSPGGSTSLGEEFQLNHGRYIDQWKCDE